jgi:hypothetical protein
MITNELLEVFKSEIDFTNQETDNKEKKLELIEYLTNIIKVKTPDVLLETAIAATLNDMKDIEIYKPAYYQYNNNIDRYLHSLYVMLSPYSKTFIQGKNTNEPELIIKSASTIYFDDDIEAYRSLVKMYKETGMNPNPIILGEQQDITGKIMRLSDIIDYCLDKDIEFEFNPKLKTVYIVFNQMILQ